MAFEKMRDQFTAFASEMAQHVLRQVEEEVQAGLSGILGRAAGKSGLTRKDAAKVTGLAGGKAKAKKTSALKGVPKDMSCRHPGCKNRSKGPRFSYLCEDHLKDKAKPAKKAPKVAKAAKGKKGAAAKAEHKAAQAESKAEEKKAHAEEADKK